MFVWAIMSLVLVMMGALYPGDRPPFVCKWRGCFEVKGTAQKPNYNVWYIGEGSQCEQDALDRSYEPEEHKEGPYDSTDGKRKGATTGPNIMAGFTMGKFSFAAKAKFWATEKTIAKDCPGTRGEMIKDKNTRKPIPPPGFHLGYLPRIEANDKSATGDKRPEIHRENLPEIEKACDKPVAERQGGQCKNPPMAMPVQGVRTECVWKGCWVTYGRYPLVWYIGVGDGCTDEAKAAGYQEETSVKNQGYTKDTDWSDRIKTSSGSPANNIMAGHVIGTTMFKHRFAFWATEKGHAKGTGKNNCPQGGHAPKNYKKKSPTLPNKPSNAQTHHEFEHEP